MSTRMTSPLAGIGWLRNALNVGSRQPGTLIGAAALFLVVMILPSLLTLPVQLGMPRNMTAFFVAFAVSMLLGLALTPVLAGLLQVIDAIERGRPTRALDVFAPYRRGEAPRIIGFALLLLLVYAAFGAIAVLAAGPEVRAMYMQLLTNPLAQPVAPTAAFQAAFPSAFLRIMLVATVGGLILSGMFAIGYAQIAIAGRSIGASFTDAVVGTLKNLLPMFLALVLLILFWIVVVIVFAILVMILALFAKVVGEWLVFVLMIPLYLALMLGMYVVLFGMAYWFWRDVCADDATATATAAL